MDKRELAFLKQSALAVKDWDIFQVIIRKCLISLRIEYPLYKNRLSG